MGKKWLQGSFDLVLSLFKYKEYYNDRKNGKENDRDNRKDKDKDKDAGKYFWWLDQLPHGNPDPG